LIVLKRLKGRSLFLAKCIEAETVKGRSLLIIECIEVFNGDEPIFN